MRALLRATGPGSSTASSSADLRERGADLLRLETGAALRRAAAHVLPPAGADAVAIAGGEWPRGAHRPVGPGDSRAPGLGHRDRPCGSRRVSPLARRTAPRTALGRHPRNGRPTVGDTITLAFRVRLDERDLLFDTVPKPALTPPDWIRIFSVEKLQRQPDRIFVGRARIAFYRPGRQAVPVFQLPFMRSVKGLSRGTLSSDSASVEVVPVLAGGSSATLRDIKEPLASRGGPPLELLLGFAALGVAGWLAWRARRSAPTEVPIAPAEEGSPPPPPDPYDQAMARLAAIERERWAAQDVARHYADITDAVRDYLEAYGIPARERTTSELRWVLPPTLLAGDGARRFEGVFEAADLVNSHACDRDRARRMGSFVRRATSSRRGRGAARSRPRPPQEWRADARRRPGPRAVLGHRRLIGERADVRGHSRHRPYHRRDPVGLRLVLRQYEGDALLESTPHPEVTLADGVRLLSVDSMRRTANRVLEARARLAFYRPGRQTIPSFAINFRRGAVILHGTVRSDPVVIEIAPVLTSGGGPTLRDIKEIVELPGPDPRYVALALSAMLVTVLAFRRRSRRALVTAPALATVDVAASEAADPFQRALERLAEIEGAGWAATGDLARHYTAVADALRDYLAAAEGIPARERTSTEVLRALPPHLSAGALRRGCAALLGEADLVKFARGRPDAAAAVVLVGDARALLVGWREASPAREVADAVR